MRACCILFWCLVANDGSRVQQHGKHILPVLHLIYVHIGFGKQPFLGQHLLNYFLGCGRVAGAGPEHFLSVGPIFLDFVNMC